MLRTEFKCYFMVSLRLLQGDPTADFLRPSIRSIAQHLQAQGTFMTTGTSWGFADTPRGLVSLPVGIFFSNLFGAQGVLSRGNSWWRAVGISSQFKAV